MDIDLSKEDAWSEMSILLRPGTFSRIHGILFPSVDFCQEYIESLATLKLEHSDVWITSFPKTGTTWTQQIVKLIRNGGENDDIWIVNSIPWLESLESKNIDISALPKPRAFKSHMPYELMPCGPPRKTPCKYVYVIRNPKDVAVSLYFHYKRYHVLPEKKLDWDLFFCNFIHGNTLFGNYLDHILSWWPHRNDDNVLVIMYEDMKRDLEKAIVQIAQFISVSISKETIRKVADKSSFKAMKANSTTNYSWLSTQNSGSEDFMRKGEVGDWENYFTTEQSAAIDKLCSERLHGTGLEFIFKL